MVEVEITGSEAVITALRGHIEPLAAEQVKFYQHGGIAGEAGLFGLLTAVLTATIPKLIEMLKPFVSQDRNLKISVNGLDISVRDLGEASALLSLLAERGLISGKDANAAPS